ncbi:MAG: response regulator [Actinomycetota bacterium]|nr:response regulator transcription factor [Actinomycetota bacterium]
MITVLVVDDQALIRSGFKLILESEDDITVLAEAGDGREAIDAARAFKPDVVLMDIRMPNMDGVEATRVIASETTSKVLILTTFDLDEYVFAAVRAGASGFLLKDVPPDDLVTAVRIVARGDALIEPRMTKRLLQEFAKRPGPEQGATTPEQIQQLTAREVEVLRLVAKGHTNNEIAEELVISEATVKTHVTHVLTKLGLRDRVQVVVLAYESGLLTGDTSQPSG